MDKTPKIKLRCWMFIIVYNTLTGYAYPPKNVSSRSNKKVTLWDAYEVFVPKSFNFDWTSEFHHDHGMKIMFSRCLSSITFSINIGQKSRIWKNQEHSITTLAHLCAIWEYAILLNLRLKTTIHEHWCYWICSIINNSWLLFTS